MATSRILADFVWDEDTPDGTSVAVDISNEDSLMIQASGAFIGVVYVHPESSLNGEDWYQTSFLDGSYGGWDGYNSYYDTSLAVPGLYTLPTFAAAPMKWFRLRLDASGGVTGSARFVIAGGVVGR